MKSEGSLLKRSDGKGFILWAWWMAALGAVCWLLGFSMPATDYMGQPDISSAQTRFACILLGCGFISLWLTLFITGSIVRAIYFLPGDTAKEDAETLAMREKAARQIAEWNTEPDGADTPAGDSN